VKAERDDGIGCGDPYVSHMAVFRTGKGGKLRHVAKLDYVTSDIQDVVDIDGDGQPELVVGEGDSSQLVDLTNAMLDTISVSSHDYGCGC
jgi:hypothetical protein